MLFQNKSVILIAMADEEQKPASNAASPAAPFPAQVPAASAPATTGGPPAGAVAEPGGEDEIIDFDPEDVDRILAEEDPAFAAELKEIQNAEFKTDVAIASVDIEVFLKEGETIKAKQAEVKKLSLKERFQFSYSSGHARISKTIDDFQNGSVDLTKRLFHFLLNVGKKAFKYSLGAVGQFFSWLLHLPKKVKLLLLSTAVLLGASGFSIYMSLKGHFLPQIGREYLTSFADHADETFEYAEQDPKESFESEIRHPEHMYEVEKIVVNLKDPNNGGHIPMGLFEFYIEMNSQEATVEVSDRKTETKHIIERILEQLTYQELTTPAGKTKLKFIIRKELNEFLSKTHHVRQVYFKTFVLKE